MTVNTTPSIVERVQANTISRPFAACERGQQRVDVRGPVLAIAVHHDEYRTTIGLDPREADRDGALWCRGCGADAGCSIREMVWCGPAPRSAPGVVFEPSSRYRTRAERLMPSGTAISRMSRATAIRHRRPGS
jgi:hypothetical protein